MSASASSVYHVRDVVPTVWGAVLPLRWPPRTNCMQPLARVASTSETHTVSICSSQIRGSQYELSWCHGTNVSSCFGSFARRFHAALTASSPLGPAMPSCVAISRTVAFAKRAAREGGKTPRLIRTIGASGNSSVIASNLSVHPRPSYSDEISPPRRSRWARSSICAETSASTRCSASPLKKDGMKRKPSSKYASTCACERGPLAGEGAAALPSCQVAGGISCAGRVRR
mmetsp:Transcript_17409/g.39808  ORF Transcript_17409/g.39808 Transcript_17409/m.39808 type:complete len:229 (+) Transcript_17409:431-1117(+)